jgi:hypothetical protein
MWLSMTRCTNSRRISPSNSIASQFCSGAVFICVPTFNLQFHGQFTVNSVVNRFRQAHCLEQVTNDGESLFFPPHLPTISCRTNTCQVPKGDFTTYLDVIFRRLAMKILERHLCFVPCSDVVKRTIWALTINLWIIVWDRSRQYRRGRSERQSNGYRREQGYPDRRPEQRRGILEGR